MHITAEFENFEEMMEFVSKMQQTTGEMKVVKKVEEQTPKCEPVNGAGSQIIEQPKMKGITNAQPAQVAPVQQVQTSVPSYTLDDLCSAAMTLMDRGMQVQLQQLLASYGVASLPELPKEQYGTFATALREMGAQI